MPPLKKHLQSEASKVARERWPDIRGNARFRGFPRNQGLVKMRGTIDGEPFHSFFMALGDDTHKRPVKTVIRPKIGRDEGDTVCSVRICLQAARA
jgi:Domain of unknown function (DUF1905)